MDSKVFENITQVQSIDFDPSLLAELGKLQAKFIRGEDVLLPLCRMLGEQSQASAVLLIDADSLVSEDLPSHATCWCHDPVRYLTLWKEVTLWPFHEQEPIPHQWKQFIIWPTKLSRTLVFFHSPSKDWLTFLLTYGELLSEILMGMLTHQTIERQQKFMTSTNGKIDNDLFKSVVSNNEDLILVVTQTAFGEPNIIYANAASTSITLYPRSQLIGKPVTLLFNDTEQPQDAYGELKHALATSDDFDGELWCVKADEQKALLQLHVVALDQHSEHGCLFALIGRDVTEQKQMQLTMARTQKMQAIGQLVGGIAHDFNNILGVLKGNLELMQLKGVDEKLERFLATAFKACGRGTDLTRKLLQFSRQEQFNAQNCQVNDVIADLSELLAKSLTSQIDFEVMLIPELSDICVDRGDLEDALLNLVINARDAMAGQGRLVIQTGESQLSGFLPGVSGNILVESGQYVWIAVIDSGSGIPPHLIDKIYEPFFSTKDKSKGTGLGLSMVYGFVKRSKGNMSVMNTSIEGTEFRLWFPVAKKKRQPTSLESFSAESLKVVDSMKVIIVDDEPELVEIMTHYCQRLGMEVESYNEPTSVLAMYESKVCDARLLISDVLMPGGVNGYELAHRMHSMHSLDVLLISGFIHDIGVNTPADMPFQVLNKPFDLSAFVGALRQVGIRFCKGD